MQGSAEEEGWWAIGHVGNTESAAGPVVGITHAWADTVRGSSLWASECPDVKEV